MEAGNTKVDAGLPLLLTDPEEPVPLVDDWVYANCAVPTYDENEKSGRVSTIDCPAVSFTLTLAGTT